MLWFGAVQQLGADKAGLLIGLMPVAAVVVDAALNGRTPSPADIAGTALVAAGVVLGARPARKRADCSSPVVRDPQSGPGNVGRRSDDVAPPQHAMLSLGRRRGESFLNVGIGLALLCAAITQLGFLCKHRGAAAAPRVELRAPLRSAK